MESTRHATLADFQGQVIGRLACKWLIKICRGAPASIRDAMRKRGRWPTVVQPKGKRQQGERQL